MTIASGTKLGRYDVRSHLGAGAMGEMYLAQDTVLGRQVALKILTRDVSSKLKAQTTAQGDEVWRAPDTRLNRDVAIKVLPATFAMKKVGFSQ